MIKWVLVLFVIGLYACITPKKVTSNVNSDYGCTKQDMLEDYDVFCNIFKSANAGLYKYRDSTDIHKRFQQNRDKIKETTSYRAFYNILWNSIDYTGSCHNTLAYPDSLDASLSKQHIFFPIPLKFINGKLYTNYNHNEIPRGSEIRSINGISSKVLSKEIAQYVSTDGFNTTGKFANIETDWLPFYMYLAYGPQESFDIRFKAEGTKKQVTLNAIDYTTFYTHYKARYSKAYEENMCALYDFKMLDSLQTGLLRVGTFAMGGPNSEGHKKYTAFLEETFTTLKTKHIRTLILDIRGNGGGHDPNDLLLYSYLTKRKFRENTSAHTLFQHVPYSSYYMYDDTLDIREELEEEHSILKHKKYYQNKSFNVFWEPNEHAFSGKVILLIDPFVASAGSLFASLLKNDTNTLVIGEETLGGYYGHTGHIPMDYELPNSKFVLSFSIVNLEQDVQPLKDQKKGQGVIPTIKIIQSYTNYLEGKDPVMQRAIDEIKRKL